MTAPAATILHADGTPCAHEPGPGPARRGGDGSWRCPAGVPVTHLRYSGTDMAIGDAVSGVLAVAAAFTAALTPVVRAVMASLARFEDLIGEDPRLRVLAAASRRCDTEAHAEADAEAERLPRVRAGRGDPCGDGQISGQLTFPGTLYDGDFARTNGLWQLDTRASGTALPAGRRLQD